ncbi:MAG TPA: Nudix family hydrolase [Methylophilaceae bacterium]|nr:Nudix family hydrolase [Methylophilaceae bacterium]
MSKNITVDAAVAVLMRPDGQVLLGKRPEGKPWAGWWEFPGGKIEDGESALHALQRELDEELGTRATEVYPWLMRSFDYPEKTVRLHFFMVRDWTAEPHGREGQALSWQNPASLEVGPMLPANEPILAALMLPPVYAITNLAETSEDEFMAQLKQALSQGLRLIQIREKQLARDALYRFAEKVLEVAQPYGTRVLINGSVGLARELGAHGVHLSSSQLLQLQERPEGLLCAASCHSAQELIQAEKLGLDFVVMGPVLSTRSHPDAATLGWEAFAGLVQDKSMPVYALGGLQPDDLTTAWQAGAHGIAMQRGIWSS